MCRTMPASGLVDSKHLLDFGAAPVGDHRLVSERRLRTVPKALARVLLHRAQRVLGVLAALVFIEAAEHLADQIACGVVAEVLGDGLHLDPGPAQLANVELAEELLAEEARHGVDEDDVERPCRRGGGIDHALELGAAVIGRGGARLDERRDERKSASRAELFALAELIGD